ncbi:MFS transporter [Micromonospora sp. URMC 106]|uniref:MFS transporter n=1 Tax=Micromonospora sp. URMC 106 TaxID=3423408 RepID=UPI003F1B93FE
MEPAGLSSGRRLLLATLSAVAVANIYYAQPLLARIGADLAIPEQHVGWIVGIGQIGYLLGLVALVPLGDLANRRLLMAAHVAFTAVGTGLIALSATTVGVLAGAALAGLFSVVVQIAVAYAAAVSSPAERGRDIGAVTSGVVIGILAARTVAGTLADAAGWRTVYAVSALASLALAGAVLALLPREARQNRDRGYLRTVNSALRLPLSDRTFRGRALLCFFLFASFGTLWSGIALPLSDEPWNLSATQIGLFGIAGLTGALGAARAGRWADRGLATPVTGWSLLLLILSWMFTAQAPHSLPLLVIGVVALDFAVQAVHVTSQQLVTAGRPEAASRTIGAYMVFYSLGSALGAVSTTWAYSAAGWALTSLLGAAYGVAALIVWAISRHDARFAPSARRPVGAGALGRDVVLG